MRIVRADVDIVKVPLADEKSAKAGWIFDPRFIQSVQCWSEDEDKDRASMESIDAILLALAQKNTSLSLHLMEYHMETHENSETALRGCRRSVATPA